MSQDTVSQASDPRFQQELDYVMATGKREVEFDEARYHTALSYLVANRALLPYRLYIELPGGMGGNSDPKWDAIKEASESRCNCGNERMLEPLNPRTEFKKSNRTVVISKEKPLYVKPVGGPLTSTYIRLTIEQDALVFLNEPFSTAINFADLFSSQGYELQQLAEALPQQPEPPVLMQAKTPLLVIDAVDVTTETVTVTLDDGVEGFADKDEVSTPAHTH